MGVFEEAYKEFALDEIIFRLPGSLAVGEFKRRIKTAEDIFEVLKVKESKDVSNELTVREHINDIIANMDIADFAKIDETYHPRMFKWLNNSNAKRLKEYGVQYVSTKLLFNITQPDEIEVWNNLLDKVLTAPELNRSHIGRIAEKVDREHFGTILNKILNDGRPEVISAILKIGGTNERLIDEQHIMIALKAYAKCPIPTESDSMRILDWDLLLQLKAQERFFVIRNYLAFMPEYEKIQVFKNMPSFQDFQNAIFPASINYNEEFNKLLEQYKRITSEDAPKLEEADEDLEETEEDGQEEDTSNTPETPVPEVAKVDELSPDQWYFQDDYVDEDEMDIFTFVRKSVWDKDGKMDSEWSDLEREFLESYIEKAGIEKNRMMECVYRCNGDDVENAVKYLKAQGFTKKRCIKK